MVKCCTKAFQRHSTFTANEVLYRVPGLVVTEKASISWICGVDTVSSAADTFLPQDPHEELETNQSEDAEAEDGQDHHVCQLPY